MELSLFPAPDRQKFLSFDIDTVVITQYMEKAPISYYRVAEMLLVCTSLKYCVFITESMSKLRPPTLKSSVSGKTSQLSPEVRPVTGDGEKMSLVLTFCSTINSSQLSTSQTSGQMYVGKIFECFCVLQNKSFIHEFQKDIFSASVVHKHPRLVAVCELVSVVTWSQ